MPISRADIPVDNAQGLVEQLCEDWSSAHPIDREETQARVTFDEGTCLLQAERDRLIVSVESLEDGSLDRLEGRVNATLEGLAGESLDIVWEN